MKTKPGEIERESMAIIDAELAARGIALEAENAAVIRRCIHASADFDYAETLRFTPDAVKRAVEALRGGVPIVTDTNMAKAGVSRAALERLGGEVHCFMAEPAVAAAAKERGTTRAAAAVDSAVAVDADAVFAVGNAPTALYALADRIGEGLRPALVVAVPVGFVNVVEGKERVFAACAEAGVPCIAAMGRKGGSSVAAAILNALIYTAADMLEPEKRGWN